MDEEAIRKDFEEWAIKEEFDLRRYSSGQYVYLYVDNAWLAWLESARRADHKARLECERIALQYSQAYGQIDDAMSIARDIRVTIKEDT